MLIHITNRCYEGCPHCMQDSNHLGKDMDFDTFKKTVQFGVWLGCSIFVLSGGEPTEHPLLLEFCQYLDKIIRKNKLKTVISITSNGTWYPRKKDIVEEIVKLQSFAGMQVYTNKKWYKDADYILKHKDEINAIPKVSVDTTDIMNMQDLGRAKNNDQAQKEIAASKYHMSCLNSHLLFRQVSSMHRLKGIVRHNLMCKPMVDFKGDVHLSESWLCPSFGNVNTDLMMEIFKNLQKAKPCYGCKLGNKFLKSDNPNIIKARELLSK